MATAPKSITDTAIVVTVNPTVGTHNLHVKKGDITSSITTVVATAPGIISAAKLTDGVITIDGTGLGADQTLVVINKPDGTPKASDSITTSTDTQIVAVSASAAVGDTVTVVTPTGEATATIVAGTVVDSVTVTFPNAAGLTWKRGTSKTVTWNKAGSHQAVNVKIELMKGTAVSRVLASSTPNDGSQSVSIPSNQATGTDYKIRITSLSHTPTYSDLSDNTFSITR